MTAFGNFAPTNTGSAEKQSGSSPADIGLGGAGNSDLVAQAWAFSPANLIKPSSPSELPTTGYGAGPRARLDDAILKNFEISQRPTGPLPLETTSASAPAANDGFKTFRKILPEAGFNGRAADTTTSSRPADLIDALSGPRVTPEAKAQYSLPPDPFTLAARAATAELNVPAYTPASKAETGPFQTVARFEAPRPAADPAAPAAPTPAFESTSRPLLANLNKDVIVPSIDSYNARMARLAGIEALSRQIMPPDFSPPKTWPAAGQNRSREADPFLADNCYQSMEFSPDGTVRTTTTLPDLSASKIEAVNFDGSKSVALTDHLGRPTVEQRIDATGQLVSHTSSRFDHPKAPMVPSQRTIQTATQTIETGMDESGKVIRSKIMPYSDLNANKSIA